MINNENGSSSLASKKFKEGAIDNGGACQIGRFVIYRPENANSIYAMHNLNDIAKIEEGFLYIRLSNANPCKEILSFFSDLGLKVGVHDRKIHLSGLPWTNVQKWRKCYVFNR